MKHKFIISILVLFALISCKSTKNHPVQSFPFDININMTLPSYDDLLGVGGYAYVPGAVKGIVVYRKSVSEFIAFDRKQTTEAADDCEEGLTVNPDNFLILDDPCSSVQYSLYDGSIVTGEVEWGLRQYIVEWDGNSSLRIYNL